MVVPSDARVARVMKRTLLFALIALVVIEVAWQLAALATRNIYARSAASAPREGALTILCVGDSHTYGAPLPEPQSYPFQLERSLRSTYQRDIQVVNLGVPGMNTPMVANRLEGQIARLHPDLVIAWAGANSFWNATETESWEGWTNALRGWLFHQVHLCYSAATFAAVAAWQLARRSVSRRP